MGKVWCGVCTTHRNKKQKNKISKSRKDNSSGIGIENVKKRLSIIYSEKHTLEILNNEEFYEVNLKIDL